VRFGQLRMLELRIPNDIYEQMIEQAIAEAPTEACGILAGRDSIVERMYRMTNTEAREDHYTMEPKEQFAVAKDIRAAGLDMLAIYHSHPTTPARPSAEDVRLAFTPNIAYVIISLGESDGPVIKGFSVSHGRATDVNVRIEKE